MNRPEHAELWNRIQQFEFDDAGAAITFSRKLADQQKWSPAYTAKAIEEYRKFIFLCCISPNGASPSKTVDEVWHLHLTYTQSYWNAFCKKTLEKDIHHYPSAGGTRENHKHTNWYAETLALYQHVFGTMPPADIWTTAGEPLLIDDSTWLMPGNLILIIVCLLLLPFVISYAITGTMSPYSLAGPDFLLFYALLIAATTICYYRLQKAKLTFMQQLIEKNFPANVTVFQLANFLYGKHRAVQTGIVDLYQRDLLKVNSKQELIIHNTRYHSTPNEQNPLIASWQTTPENSQVAYETISGKWYNQEAFNHPVLQRLIVLTKQMVSAKIKFFVLFFTGIIGIARIMQGIHNERPVVFLVLEIIALIIVVVILEKKMSEKQVLYDVVEGVLREKAGDGSLHTDTVVREFAVHGPSITDLLPAGLAMASLFVLFPMINNPRAGWVDTGASMASNCSSSDSSCSSGSSCSGDSSCSGGGCGGCGGGGGD